MSPAPLTHFSQPANFITITACDSHTITSAQFTFNGSAVSFSGGISHSCTGKQYTQTLTFNAGANTLSTQVCASDGCNTMSATYYYNVPVSTVAVSPTSATIRIGANNTVSLTATAYDANNNPIPTASISWTPAGAVTISPSSGTTTTATGQFAGTGTATASSGGKSGSATITVQAASVATSITIALGTYSLVVGEAGTTATATVYDQYGATMPSQTVSWSADTPGIAGVSSTGAQTASVTGIGIGSTTIRASIGGVSGTSPQQVVVSQAGVISVSITGQHASGAVARDQCLTIAASDAAAYECGDLRIIHPLSTTTTMNKARTPVLIYSSNHAQPTAVVAADIIYSGDVPSTVQGTLAITVPGSSQKNVSFSFPWKSACAGQSCRVIVPVDALSLSLTEGAYDFVLQVNAVNASNSTLSSGQGSGTLVIVDRSQSPFGAGWWLDGLEHLVAISNHTNHMLWIGGDGSTRIYIQDANNQSIWTVQPTVDRPDTLEQIGSLWHRHLRNGAYVEFDNLLRHRKTVNSRGWTTRFDPVDSTSRVLLKITLPVTGNVTAPVYTFAYYTNQDGTPRILQSVTAPAITVPGHSTTRQSVITPRTPTNASDFFIRKIQDLLSVSWDTVTFEAPNGSSNLISARTNRDSARTAFGYDSYNKLIRVDRYNSYKSVSQPQLTSYWCPAETRANSSCTRGSGTIGALALDLSRNDSTIYDGARVDVTDVTKFLVDGWGAPITIVDAKNNATQLIRGDARFPLLATEVDAPNGRVTTATYSNRGLVLTSVDHSVSDITGVSGDVATTTYAWHSTYDLLIGITTPQGVATTIDYFLDPNDPARFRARQAQYDSRGVNSAVTWDYFTDSKYFGLAKSTTLPQRSASQSGTASETYAYDDNGNLVETLSPANIQHWTLRDGVGRIITDSAQLDRVAQANPPTWKTQSITYDDLDRVLHTTDIGPARGSYASLQLDVVQDYDPEGRPLDLTRTAAPSAHGPLTTRFTYDVIGRRITEETQDVDVNGQQIFRIDTTMYDEAGNVKYHRNRRLLKTTYAYDELNRITSRSDPAFSYAQELKGMADPQRSFQGDDAHPYPYYPNNTTTQNYDIYANNATFTYDPVSGLMTDANNGYAQVHRDYYLNGLLKDEVLKIANWSGAGTSPTFGHSYTTAYSYDKDSRRTKITYPGLLTPSPTQNYALFGYDASGMLHVVTDLLGQSFNYSYNWRNERTELYLAGGLDSVFFDDEGQLTRHSVHSPSAFDVAADIRDEVFDSYDALGRLLHSKDSKRLMAENTASYDGLGQARYSDYSTLEYAQGPTNSIVSRYTLDALGNLTETDGNDIITAGQPFSNTPTGITQNTYDLKSGRQTTTEYGILPLTRFSYDSSGNLVWRTNADPSTIMEDDRQSYYGADELLRAVDARNYQNATTWDRTFEEYWYDALGRRVLVRSRRYCVGEWIPNTPSPNGECAVSTIRRVIWDGSQELGEIQMPGADGANLENDTQISFQQTLVSQSPTDANHFYGIVAYTFGTALDRPLSAMRMNYSDGLTGSAWYAFHSAFDVIPLWNDRGQMDGAFYNYGASSYSEQASPNDIRRDSLDVPADWYAYARSQYVPSGWHGTLLSDKADNSGMLYRRNRYYDPSTGRFTQEDPIGLAGGLNVYGFAGGDPVNFSDPFGLCPPKDNTPCPAQQIDNSDGLGWARFAGAMLKPAQPILEAAANAEMAFMPLGELGEAANITKLGLREGKVEEGIYEFTATSEKVYVGQSGNISQRLLQHVRSGKLAASDVTSVSRTEVLGGKTAREIAEQRRINQLGGIVNLENKVNPIGPARLHLLNNP